MKLRLFTLSNCPRCPEAKRVAEAVAARRKDVFLEILDLSNQENMTTALMMQIASTPAFAIDDTAIFISEVPSFEDLNAKIEEHKLRFQS